jgi:hypothetical protein
MLAYREIVRNQEDILHISQMLEEINSSSEVIIVPLNQPKEEDMKNIQISSMSKTWNNEDDEAWNEL